MNRTFVVFLLLVLSQFAGAAPAVTPAKLTGKWESKSMEFIARRWIKRTLEIKPPNYVYLREWYETPSSKEPYLELRIEGPVTVKANPVNPQALAMDMGISKNTLLVKKVTPQVGTMNLTDCAKVNVPVDLKELRCGKFKRQNDVEKVFSTALMLDDNTVLINTWRRRIPKRERERPNVVSIQPLVRKP